MKSFVPVILIPSSWNRLSCNSFIIMPLLKSPILSVWGFLLLHSVLSASVWISFSLLPAIMIAIIAFVLFRFSRIVTVVIRAVVILVVAVIQPRQALAAVAFQLADDAFFFTAAQARIVTDGNDLCIIL